MKRQSGTLAWRTLGAAGAALCFAITAYPQITPSITVEDCSKLKGKAKAACQARVEASKTQAGSGSADKFPFPEEQSKGTDSERHPAVGDMPTSGVADPPAESMRPLKPDGTPDEAAPPQGATSSSTSSSSSSPGDEDAPATTAGGDSPVKASALKDLGSHGDVSAARTKLEESRVADDLKVGHFYLKDGNYSGAVARYQDALAHDSDNPEAHYGLAEVLLKQGKRDEAIAHLQRYLQLAPDEDHSKDARKLLAKLNGKG